MIGVDVGGTFTDVVAIRDGEIVTAKVATQVLDSYKGVLEGAAAVDASKSDVFNHASTHGLNAVITRRLPKVGLLTTQGHRDMLDHGSVMRPREALTDASWRREFSDVRRPLVPRYLRRGVEERSTVDGDILIPLNEDQALEQIRLLKKCDVDGVAICLLHSYVNGSHEERLRELVRQELGDIPCSISSEVSPLAKEYARASTTVVDAMMKLIYGEYTQHLKAGLAELGFEGQLNYADSAAMLISADFAMQQPYRIVFAGPAAGTAASVHLGKAIGEPNLLCADVGGTSCDISVVIEGEAFRDITFELEYDLIVNSLTNEISSLGAGGGSVVWINKAGELRVGPDSAGASPGPACYGTGGTRPTMTDACLLMGVLDPDALVGGALKLHPELAQRAFDELDTKLPAVERVRAAWEIGLNNVVEGLYNIALKHGVDPADYSVLAYGAAGPMILPSLLGKVQIRQVIVPPHPGLFSALGLLSSDLVYSDSKSAYVVVSEQTATQIEEIFTGLEEKLLERIGVERAAVQFVRTFDGRLYGQSWETPFVSMPEGPVGESVEQMVEAFHDEYRRRNGGTFRDFPVEAVTFRVQVIASSEKLTFPTLPARGDDPLEPVGRAVLRHVYDGEVKAMVYERTDLRAGDHIEGPAVIREAMSTTFVPAERSCVVGELGELSIS